MFLQEFFRCFSRPAQSDAVDVLVREAIQQQTQIIERDNTAEAYHDRAINYINLGHYSLAIQDLTSAIRLDPEWMGLYRTRAIAHLKNEDDIKAIEDCHVFLKSNCHDIEALNIRGVAYQNMGADAEAIRDHSKIIQLHPTNMLAYLNRGAIYLSSGKYYVALQDFNEAYGLLPLVEIVDKKRRKAYQKAGGFSAVIKAYSDVLARHPDAEVYYNRSMAYQFFSDNAVNPYKKLRYHYLAFKDCLKAIERNPQRISIYLSHSKLRAAFNQFAQKSKVFDDFLSRLEGRYAWDKIQAVLAPKIAAAIYNRKQNQLVQMTYQVAEKFNLPPELSQHVMSYMTDKVYLKEIENRITKADEVLAKIRAKQQPNQVCFFKQKPQSNEIPFTESNRVVFHISQ